MRRPGSACWLGRHRRRCAAGWTEAFAVSDDAIRAADALGDTSLMIEALTARQPATSGPDDIEELVRLAGRMADLGTSTGRADVEMWACSGASTPCGSWVT